MKTYTINEVKDTFIGEHGTPERTKYEAKLSREQQRAKIKKAILPFFRAGDSHYFFKNDKIYFIDEFVEEIVKELNRK